MIGIPGGQNQPVPWIFFQERTKHMETSPVTRAAEAMLLIPLIVPLAQSFGISAQLCIVAFAFGDGFSNILYPTNAALLVGLGLGECSYPKWIRFSLPFQLLNLVLTCGLLLPGLALGVA